MKIFFDFEFTGLRQDTTPVSMAMISEYGPKFYAEFTDFDISQFESDDWVARNIGRNLLFKNEAISSYQSIDVIDKGYENCGTQYTGLPDEITTAFGPLEFVREKANEFLQRMDDSKYESKRGIDDRIKMWGDCLAYDWILFVQVITGTTAIDLPMEIDYIPMDLATLLWVKGFDPDVSREDFVFEHYPEMMTELPLGIVGNKHNALSDAYMMKCMEEILSTM